MGPKKKQAQHEEEDAVRARIAIVNADKCKPKKCKHECKKSCPVNKTQKMCIEVDASSKISWISETLCIGCGICTKRCPFHAITIINIPEDLGKDTTHRFGPNTFKLHRLPLPRPGQVLGLVGTNGIGKSTALKILAGKLKPNLGRFAEPPDWSAILAYFRGSELQGYFTKILEANLKALIKPQYVEHVAKTVDDIVSEVIKKKDELGVADEFCTKLELNHLMERRVSALSGGELQRMSICTVGIQDVSVYMFDEPSSYLDVKQRIAAAKVIRSIVKFTNYVIVVEHDLSILDYLSDFVCCLWGAPSVYGVVTMPFGVREGINVFLDGFVPTENLRFREESLTFKVAHDLEEEIKRHHNYEYYDMQKTLDTFKLTIEGGQFSDSEIIVMLGQNGTGKSTFIRMLAGLLTPDDAEVEMPRLHVSYKPQTLSPKFQGTVKQLFLQKIRDSYLHPQFQSDVVKPMNIEPILEHDVQNLSGGELQRVALILALGKPADIYLIDEPSAYLDSEQRIAASKVIKRYILHAKKTAFVVEHDFIMSTYLADKVIVYEGTPGVDCIAKRPESLLTGMNRFLKSIEITFRRDPTFYRPRINKLDSVKDRQQKLSGNFFLLDDD